jgi:hypothetical protein
VFFTTQRLLSLITEQPSITSLHFDDSHNINNVKGDAFIMGGATDANGVFFVVVAGVCSHHSAEDYRKAGLLIFENNPNSNIRYIVSDGALEIFIGLQQAFRLAFPGKIEGSCFLFILYFMTYAFFLLFLFLKSVFSCQ